jgi:hypothetical protein
MARAIEVGERDQAFSTRAFCAPLRVLLGLERLVAPGRPVDLGQRRLERLEGRADFGQHAASTAKL